MREALSGSIRRLASELKSSFRIEREEESDIEVLEGEPLKEIVYTPSNPDSASAGAQYSTNNPKVTEDSSSLKEKTYKAAPKIKPRRRQVNNESDTRGYRRDYQQEYRRENGSGYIKKLKKPGEDQDAS
jgi:hypothetical protein